MANENPEMQGGERPVAPRETPYPAEGTAAATPMPGRVRERVGSRTLFAESGAPVPGTSRPPMTPTRRRLLVFTWLAIALGGPTS